MFLRTKPEPFWNRKQLHPPAGRGSQVQERHCSDTRTGCYRRLCLWMNTSTIWSRPWATPPLLPVFRLTAWTMNQSCGTILIHLLHSKEVSNLELISKSIELANVVKEIDPNADVFGPAFWGMLPCINGSNDTSDKTTMFTPIRITDTVGQLQLVHGYQQSGTDGKCRKTVW